MTSNGKSIYDESVIDSYRGRTRAELPPSIFAVAEEAFSNLLRFREPQSVVVSGESGAGKTEACRQVLSFIARVSGDYAQAARGRTGRGKGNAAADATVTAALRVKDRLITSNLVLEALGNAQTVRNDNSSRFGKLMRVYFKSSGVASGGDLTVYLLEKNRLTFQQDGERSFHIMYQLTQGATADMRSSLHIKPTETYSYLNNEARQIPGVRDGANFKALVECLKILGIDAAQQKEIWRLLSVVLNLGNIRFASESEGGDSEDRKKHSRSASEEEAEADAQAAAANSGGHNEAQLNAHAAKVVDDGASGEAAKAVASLLGVEFAAVEKALTTRTIVVRNEATSTILSPAEARAARDSLARAVYERLFLDIVRRINEAIATNASAAPAPAPAAAAAAAAAAAVKKAATPGKGVAAAAPAAAKAPAAASAAASAAPANGKKAELGSPVPNSSNKSAAGSASPASDAAPAAAPAADAAAEAEAEPEAEQQEQESQESLRSLSLAILDLYGFEVLNSNGFDQLLINFVNEKLQQLFITATLFTEQAEYEAEGIEWTPVEYFDNAVVLSLLEGGGKEKPGIFQLLDDANNMADSDDNKLLDALTKKVSKHEHFTAKKIKDGRFGIKHYAGEVTYSCDGMTTANKDTLNNDLVTLMRKAKGTPLGNALFVDKRTDEEKKKRAPSASSQFKTSVAALIQTLSATDPHYVRCIKPNDKKAALFVDDERMAHQVRYLGLVENVTVKKGGFAYREDYDTFLRRYRMVSDVRCDRVCRLCFAHRLFPRSCS